jgi:hypothetical protein
MYKKFKNNFHLVIATSLFSLFIVSFLQHGYEELAATIPIFALSALFLYSTAYKI